MRLIDADALIEEYPQASGLKLVIENAPTAYNVDKVLEEVTEKAERYCKAVGCEHCYTDCDHYNLMQSVCASIAKGGVEHG